MRQYIVMILWGGLLVLSSCGGAKRMEKKPPLTTTPAKLELFVNQQTDPYTVKVDYVLHIPEKYVPSCGRLIYAPRFVHEGNVYPLRPIVITGRKWERLAERRHLLEGEEIELVDAKQVKTDGGAMSIRIVETVPFQLWMPTAQLVATVSLESCNREKQLYSQTLANGMVYIPLAPGPALVKYVKKEVAEEKHESLSFYFPVNRYQIQPGWKENSQKELRLKNLLRQIAQDTTMHLKKIIVTGMCSPEGNYAYNQRLAERRAEAVAEYLLQDREIQRNEIEVRIVAEDWEGLRQQVDSLRPADSRAVQQLWETNNSDAQREALLRRLPQYAVWKEQLFPQLRKAVCEIFYEIREIKTVIEPE